MITFVAGLAVGTAIICLPILIYGWFKAKARRWKF